MVEQDSPSSSVEERVELLNIHVSEVNPLTTLNFLQRYPCCMLVRYSNGTPLTSVHPRVRDAYHLSGRKSVV